jgi:hypothetical protein
LFIKDLTPSTLQNSVTATMLKAKASLLSNERHMTQLSLTPNQQPTPTSQILNEAFLEQPALRLL